MNKQSTNFIKAYRLIILAFSVTSLCSCISTGGKQGLNLYPTQSIAEKQVELLPQHLRLDVGIEEFDANYTLAKAKAYEVYPEVRKAEAKYFPLRLRDAVQKTDFWNGVWVVPQVAIADVKVQGKIIKSDGKYLKLKILAMDATGKTLLNSTYDEEATNYDYSGGRKPFENLFRRIAQDLVKIYDRIEPSKISQVKKAADLRFANWIAPDAFSHHLDSSKNNKIVSLPAANDPIYQQALVLREYDALFFDKLQDYYDEFYGQVDESYSQWAHESYLEIEARQRQKREALTTGVVSGLVAALGVIVAAKSDNPNVATAGVVATAAGGAGIYKAVKDYQKSKLHDEALQELGSSLESSVRPHTIELEGRTVELEGSIEQQYLQWHQALKNKYIAQTQPA